MMYKFSSIRLNVTKYADTFATKEGSNPLCNFPGSIEPNASMLPQPSLARRSDWFQSIFLPFCSSFYCEVLLKH